MSGGRGDGIPLQFVEVADAGFGEIHHFEETRAREGVALGGGLDFDAVAVFGHDQVHVDFGLGVFFVGEVEEDRVFDDAHAGGGDELAEGRRLEGSRGDHAVEGDGEGRAGSGDGGGACASVGLQDVAVEDDGALAEGFHVDNRAERATDEALDLVGAAADFAFFGLPRSAGEGGAREHAVFGGDPSAAAVAEPGGDALFDGGVAEDAGVSDLDEDGAFSNLDVAGGEAGGAHLGGLSAFAAEKSGLSHRLIVRFRRVSKGETAWGGAEMGGCAEVVGTAGVRALGGARRVPFWERDGGDSQGGADAESGDVLSMEGDGGGDPVWHATCSIPVQS